MTSALHALLRRNLVLYDSERTRWRLHDLVRAFAYRALVDAEELNGVAWRYAHVAVVLARNFQDQYLAGGDTALLALARFEAERAHIGAAHHWARHHTQTPDGDRRSEGRALANLGISDTHLGELPKAISYYEQRLAIARAIGPTRSGTTRTSQRITGLVVLPLKLMSPYSIVLHPAISLRGH